MIEHVGVSIENDLQCFIDPLKIRDQHLDAAIRRKLANLADGLGENSSAADVVIVAVHAGHDRVFQSQRGYRFGDAAWFVPVDGLGPALGHSAEAATPRADIAEKHEGCGFVVPAFANVRALRRLAYGVQAESTGQLFQVMEVVA